MVAKSALAAFLFLLLRISLRAEWTIGPAQSEPSTAAGVERRHLTVANAESGNEATIELALFSAKSVAVRVVDNPGGDELISVAKRTRALAGVNGGYFDPQNAPLGLVVSDGKMIAPFRKARLLRGVLVVNKSGVELVRSTEYSARKTAAAAAALQCGPFLVDGGAAVSGLNNSRPARRTFFITSGPDRAGMGF